jgi:hypothetical protein
MVEVGTQVVVVESLLEMGAVGWPFWGVGLIITSESPR